MKKIFIKILPIVLLATLSSCSVQQTNGKKGNIDPFMIGDNLEAINLREAQIIASEAYNNLSHIAKVAKEIKTTTDTTGLYAGSLSMSAEKSNKDEKYEIEYYKNVLNRKYSFSEKTENPIVGKATDERRNEMTEWYDYKKGSETEFALYTKTTTSTNGVEWDTYAISNENFANLGNLTANWNRYLITNANEYSDVSIHYSDDMHYVRDGMHILGYKTSKEYMVGRSIIAPLKEDISIVTQIDNISIVAYVKKAGIGWITESVAVKTTLSVLNNLSGVVVDPIVMETNESVASFAYVNEHESHSVPKYKEDTSGDNPLFISSFNSLTHEFESTIVQFSNNDDYYRQIEAGYNGKAFYIERYLPEGYYSIYDKDHTLSFDAATYEVWGYKDIIDNRCQSFILDAEIEEHPGFFLVNKAGVYSFDIVFDKDMENITTFTVAKMG